MCAKGSVSSEAISIQMQQAINATAVRTYTFLCILRFLMHAGIPESVTVNLLKKATPHVPAAALAVNPSQQTQQRHQCKTLTIPASL